ncbi:hypothetical protein DCO58_08730 [Helicobacter saguini]|uniref:CR-type domain-containing protein n=1 Tax=Helicobacter saguini TaxID=1548018 RepID=A0A347VXK5_9HELI|nr:hypothetical protein [Helicobacter saguini]MWV61594.1 hypothetical protein [Helicobacter saguini]MWV67734.1 hypothetical protein [Helicobacter saguini]MWV70797.1 hypothetical protein [Helicobacter saguini]MWV72701.1 hypothetical protein [Helicobacter saguini]TLD94497.1 hypothetical protein LS64_004830 [Helicobacter saguini]
MLDNYKQDSINTINKWLNEQTRFKNNVLEIEDYKDFIFHFKVYVTYQIVADHITMSYPGERSSGIYCSGYADFCYQIKQSEMLEVKNRNTLDKLYNMVQNNKYGFIKNTLKLKSGESFYYTSPCTSCHNGITTCFSCGGRGRDMCNFCSGLGNLHKTRQATAFDGSSYTESYMERCVHCHGSGYNECSSCHGRGEVTCSTCGGSGVKTEVASISVYAVARWEMTLHDGVDSDVESALKRVILADLERYGETNLLESSADSSVYEEYHASVPFAKILTNFNGNEIKWIVFGKNLQISDAGGVLDLLLEGDLINLAKNARLCYFKPFIAISSKNAIINFMQNSIFETLFKKDSIYGNMSLKSVLNGNVETRPKIKFKDAHITERAERDCEILNNAISYEFVKTALDSMYKLTKTICFYSNIKWFLFFLFIAFGVFMYDKLHNFAIAKNTKNMSNIYTYKKDDVTYLNKSYLNIFDVDSKKDSKNTKDSRDITRLNSLKDFSLGILLGNMWDALSFHSILIFVLGAFVAYFYRKFWFKFRAANLDVWLHRYDINKSRYFLFLFFGALIIGLVFYFFPIFITENNYVYGILPLDYFD